MHVAAFFCRELVVDHALGPTFKECGAGRFQIKTPAETAEIVIVLTGDIEDAGKYELQPVIVFPDGEERESLFAQTITMPAGACQTFFHYPIEFWDVPGRYRVEIRVRPLQGGTPGFLQAAETLFSLPYEMVR